ncbi:MAG TPA: fibrinogen-like YCDxxxxGGGW domain-containing protein, partial [Nannocystaceae bacterium]|nr:fibrinogen-like YCDxxxxGGGW domain-containing protein [Nannocystaceae bacterium]
EAPMVTETGGGTMTGGSSTSTGGDTTGVAPFCGDGKVDAGEACDDGAKNGPGEACKADCTANVCGDGDQGPGEGCDAGADNSDTGLCKLDCTPAACGDGLVQPGEGCDDGNQVDDDACTNTCKLASCGDGQVQPPEACDDGNADNADACTDKCLLPTCGDGFIQADAGEACDDGPANDDNADCTSGCKVASCGDGLLHDQGGGAEECDDANDVDDDACSNGCVLATCEDQLKNGSESDVDCGGEGCVPCGFGDGCLIDDDCDTLFCGDGGTCVWALSCAQIKAKIPDANSGTYMIDPDGDGPGLPFDAVCDMETDGGGWTLIANLHSNRIPGSIYRGKRFFTAGWKQLLNGNEVTTNDQVGLALDAYGMLDAQSLISGSADLRYHCEDQTRSLEADAIWTPSAADWTELLGSLIYSATPRSAKVASNGGDYAIGDVWPTAANLHTYGCWHICGNCGPAQQQQSFQLGVCGTSPAQGDSGLANLRQVAIGYHDGYSQLRLECTADTPGNTPVLNGTWQAWVR